MLTISKMLNPRENVFSDTARENVLNLTDLAENKIDAKKFYGENFQTQGMTVLFDTAFARHNPDCSVRKLNFRICIESKGYFYSSFTLKIRHLECILKTIKSVLYD